LSPDTHRHLPGRRPPCLRGHQQPAQPNYGAINVIHSGTSSNFDGGFISLQRKLTRGLQFTANYEYSHALDDNIGEGGNTSDPTNLHRDYGNADSDIRHNFTFQGIYTTKFNQGSLHWLSDFEFSTMAYLNSGFPINPVAGVDLNNDGVSNDRPPPVRRAQHCAWTRPPRGRHAAQAILQRR